MHVLRRPVELAAISGRSLILFFINFLLNSSHSTIELNRAAFYRPNTFALALLCLMT